MTKVNPLHIVALLVVLILFLLFQIVGVKKQLITTADSLHQSKEIALKTVAYKELYNKEKVKKALERILRQSSLKNANIIVQRDKERLTMKAKSLSLGTLNSLMSKIFNGAYTISRLSIKRVDAQHASLQMEIRW